MRLQNYIHRDESERGGWIWSFWKCSEIANCEIKFHLVVSIKLHVKEPQDSGFRSFTQGHQYTRHTAKLERKGLQHEVICHSMWLWKKVLFSREIFNNTYEFPVKFLVGFSRWRKHCLIYSTWGRLLDPCGIFKEYREFLALRNVGGVGEGGGGGETKILGWEAQHYGHRSAVRE